MAAAQQQRGDESSEEEGQLHIDDEDDDDALPCTPSPSEAKINGAKQAGSLWSKMIQSEELDHHMQRVSPATKAPPIRQNPLFDHYYQQPNFKASDGPKFVQEEKDPTYGNYFGNGDECAKAEEFGIRNTPTAKRPPPQLPNPSNKRKRPHKKNNTLIFFPPYNKRAFKQRGVPPPPASVNAKPPTVGSETPPTVAEKPSPIIAENPSPIVDVKPSPTVDAKPPPADEKPSPTDDDAKSPTVDDEKEDSFVEIQRLLHPIEELKKTAGDRQKTSISEQTVVDFW